jgi:phosphoinositide-3-kinase regulatory subunit 4
MALLHLHVCCRIEANSNKMSGLQTRQLNLHEDGCAVDINYFDSGVKHIVRLTVCVGSWYI